MDDQQYISHIENSHFGGTTLTPLARALMSVPVYNIRFLDRYKPSIFDRVRIGLEYLTQSEWDWWPLEPPRKRLGKGDLRACWKCHCGKQLYQDIGYDEGRVLQRLVNSREYETRRIDHFCLRTASSRECELYTAWRKTFIEPLRAICNSVYVIASDMTNYMADYLAVHVAIHVVVRVVVRATIRKAFNMTANIASLVERRIAWSIATQGTLNMTDPTFFRSALHRMFHVAYSTLFETMLHMRVDTTLSMRDYVALYTIVHTSSCMIVHTLLCREFRAISRMLLYFASHVALDLTSFDMANYAAVRFPVPFLGVLSIAGLVLLLSHLRKIWSTRPHTQVPASTTSRDTGKGQEDVPSKGSTKSGSMEQTQQPPFSSQTGGARPSQSSTQQGDANGSSPITADTSSGAHIVKVAEEKTQLWILFGITGSFQCFELEQIDARQGVIEDDGELFQLLKFSYGSMKRYVRRTLSVWKLRHCDIIKFTKPEANHIFRDLKGPDLPPQSHRLDYDFDDTIGAALTAHEFEAGLNPCSTVCRLAFLHQCVRRRKGTRALQRIPKKRTLWPLQEDSQPREAWGLYAREVPSALKVIIYQILILLVPSAFWVWWLAAVDSSDWQTASVPAAIVIALQSIFWTQMGVLRLLADASVRGSLCIEAEAVCLCEVEGSV